ncbi:hypothetical protein ACFODZ_11785 [Marinicella sediminis]|uniref:Lipoprotein n=1 Tax=Marinicella sediminis TaxID=1792834 RepID=A0ABV7JE14_9GAMM|nr:hypothetical protein [Marinicella sediminis]
MNNKRLIISQILFFFIIGCQQVDTVKPLPSGHYSVWEIIEKTEARAPDGLTGEFKLHIKNSGKQLARLFLNTQEDYRDRRNITVTLLPSFQEAFQKKYNENIRSYFEDHTILVRGEAKRMKVWFFSNGRRTEKYYFQTHIIVSDLDQITRLD